MQRPPFVFWTSIWAGSIAFAAAAMVIDALRSERWLILGRDFSNMWTSGRLALEGHAHRAFDVDAFRLALLDKLQMLSLQNFSYPPHTLFLNAPFGAMPYFAAFALWSVVGLSMFAFAARSYLPKGFPAWLAAATPAAGFCVWDGQYGLFLGALWLCVFGLIDRRPVRAGILAGIMTIKPHLGLLIAAILTRSWRALAAAVVTTLLLVGASAAAFGAGTWPDFLLQTTAAQADVLTRQTGDFYFKLMVGSYTAFGKGAVGVAAQVMFAGFALWKLWAIRRLPSKDLAFPMSTATFLIVPYVFNYDMTVVGLGFAIILFTHWASLTRSQVIVATLCFACPALTMIHSVLAPIVLALGMQLQCRLLLAAEEAQFSTASTTASTDRMAMAKPA